MDPNKAFRRRHKKDFPRTIPTGEGHDLVVKQFLNRLAYNQGYDGGPVKVVIVEGMTVGDLSLSTYITGTFHVQKAQLPGANFINLASGRCYQYDVRESSIMFLHTPKYEIGGTK
jgi:hypothetical protein